MGVPWSVTRCLQSMIVIASARLSCRSPRRKAGRPSAVPDGAPMSREPCSGVSPSIRRCRWLTCAGTSPERGPEPPPLIEHMFYHGREASRRGRKMRPPWSGSSVVDGRG